MNVKLSFTSGDWDRSAVDEHSAGLARYGTRVGRSSYGASAMLVAMFAYV